MLWTSPFQWILSEKGLIFVLFLFFLVKMEQLVRRNKEKQIYSISDKYQYAMGVDPLFYQRMHTYLLIIQKTYS